MSAPLAANNAVIETRMAGVVSSAGSNGKNAMFVFHHLRTAGAVNPNMANFETAFQAAIAIPITNFLNHRYTQTYNNCRWMNDVTNVGYQNPRAIAGQIMGDSMPLANQGFLLLRSAVRGKAWRGSKRLFPLSESQTTTGTDDTFNAAALALLALIGTALTTNVTDSDGNVWQNVIYSRKNSFWELNPTTLYVTPITAVLVNKRIGRNKKHEVASAY